MKKIYTFLTLLLFSGVLFAQVQRSERYTLSSVEVLKEINTIPASQTKAVIDSLRYDGVNANAIGTGTSASSFGVYAFFPAATLAPHAAASHKILSLKMYIGAIATVTSFQIRFYTDTLTTAMVYSQNFTPVVGWNNITLTNPFNIPSTGNLYIGYYMVTTGGYPAGCDAGPAISNGNWINLGNWTHLNVIAPTLVGNWNIRAMCGTVPAVPTATCTPLSWAAGNVPISTTATSGTFTLSNSGAGTLTCSGISGLSAPFTTNLVPATVSLTTGATKTFTFSYNPTVVGPNNQTVILTTNGGNITINLTGTGVNCGAMTTFPWIESFEDAIFPPACWTKASPDLGTGWASIASGTTPLPGWTGGAMTVPTGGGTKAAYCTWNTGGTTANNQYLITPQIAVPTNGMLTFSLFWFGHYRDYVDVKVSTSTNAVASFTTTLLALDTLQYIHGSWKQFYVPLTSYAGQNVYLAFNEHVTDNTADGAFIGLDLVRIDVTTDVNESPAEMVNIYPNPANDKLYIAADQVKSVEIYNILGERVANFGNLKVINVSDLTIGFYFVKVTTDSKTITKKINIAR